MNVAKSVAFHRVWSIPSAGRRGICLALFGLQKPYRMAATGAVPSEDIMDMIIDLGYWLSLGYTVIWGS
jgi:hypothetical protein